MSSVVSAPKESLYLKYPPGIYFSENLSAKNLILVTNAGNKFELHSPLQQDTCKKSLKKFFPPIFTSLT